MQKLTDKELMQLSLKDFKTYFQSLLSDNKQKEAINATAIRCATDLELFSAMFFPHYCEYDFNQFHRDDFESFNFGERGVRRSRGAPRGYAKSTLKALIKPIHDLCYGLEKFIVIFSNNDVQATGKLKDIRSELLTNELLINIYGIRFPRKTIAETSFVVSSKAGEVYFQAYGKGAEVRGIRFGAYRPTKIICDDVEHSEEVFNEQIRDKDDRWYKEVVSKLGNNKTNIEFIGTILHRDSLLKKILDNPMYDSKLYRAVISWSEREDLWENWRNILRNLDNTSRKIDADAYYEANKLEMLKGTKVLWPEKESYKFLMEEMLETGRRAFMKEKQNEPMGPDDKVFSRFSYYREHEQNGKRGILIEQSQVFIPMDHMRSYGAMDPSTGQTKPKKGKLGDYTALLTGLTDGMGRLFVHRAWLKRVPPTLYIQAIFEHHNEWNYEKFAVETNLYRNLLIPNLVAERKNRELALGRKIHLPFYDIENGENKEKRIFTLEPKVTNGWILFNRNLGQEFMNQLEDFPHSDHDDGPDALEMLWKVANNRTSMGTVGLNPMAGR